MGIPPENSSVIGKGVRALRSVPFVPSLSTLRPVGIRRHRPWWSLACDILYNIETLYLFTKSDFQTLLMPVLCFATVTSPHIEPLRVVWTAMWIWVHLLQFTISNQILGVEEDRVNKAYRPLPSGRISPWDAKLLRWVLVPVCWALSLNENIRTLFASVSVTVITVIHNEFGYHGRLWIIRNILNGLGIASFEMGASLVIRDSYSHLGRDVIQGLLTSAVLFTVTIHAQDFKDIHGDILIGRLTFPILFPRMSRYSMMIELPICTVVVTQLWRTEPIPAGILLCLAVFVGFRYILFNDIQSDKISYRWYNIWLSTMNLLPGVYIHFN